MLARPIGKGDLCHWLDCIALDGGLRPGENEVQAVFIHEAEQKALEHFTPGHYADELDGKAFQDRLGEFALAAFSVEKVVTKEDFFIQSLQTLADDEATDSLMLIADMDAYGNRVKNAIGNARCKDITLFGMEPIAGRGFSQEILGYSLMSALGIGSEELTV